MELQRSEQQISNYDTQLHYLDLPFWHAFSRIKTKVRLQKTAESYTLQGKKKPQIENANVLRATLTRIEHFQRP